MRQQQQLLLSLSAPGLRPPLAAAPQSPRPPLPAGLALHRPSRASLLAPPSLEKSAISAILESASASATPRPEAKARPEPEPAATAVAPDSPRLPAAAGHSAPPDLISHPYAGPREDVVGHAAYLGMDPEADCDLLYIAEWALTAPLPDGWTEHVDGNSNLFYYNSVTGVSTYEHPLDEQYRQYYRQVKAQQAGAEVAR